MSVNVLVFLKAPVCLTPLAHTASTLIRVSIIMATSFASFQSEIKQMQAAYAKESLSAAQTPAATHHHHHGQQHPATASKPQIKEIEIVEDGRTIRVSWPTCQKRLLPTLTRDRHCRVLQERLLKPTPDFTSSLASLLHRQIDHSQGEILLCLSAHNLNDRSLASIFDTPDPTLSSSSSKAATPASPETPLLVNDDDVQTAFRSVKEACSEVSLHACILWNPLSAINGEDGLSTEEKAISRYAPETSANDDETKAMWEAKALYIMVRAKPHTAEELLELRVAVVGNVDAGKSTLLGVMTKGRLDDGRGKARVALFRHKHEIESGRTSSVGMEIMGFNPSGNEIMSDTPPAVGTSGSAAPAPAPRKKDLSWDEICKEAAKIVGFIDLAGHEKYFKTTIGALSSASPDFVLLIIGANAGIVGMSKEHLSVSLALNVPVVCVVTKIDSTPPNVLDATLKQLSKILRSPGCRKHPVFVKSKGMACALAQGFVKQK